MKLVFQKIWHNLHEVAVVIHVTLVFGEVVHQMHLF
jgi:hypothetical protein